MTLSNFFWLGLLIPLTLVADEVIVPREGTIGGGSAMDLLYEKPANVEKLKPRREDTSLSVSSTCTTKDGRSIESDDSSYESCIQNSSNKSGASPTIHFKKNKK